MGAHFTGKLQIVFWIAGVATAIAAWFGAVNAYIERYSAFTPVVAFGAPVLKLADGVVSIALPLSLSNAGGKSGCVVDMALKLQSKATNTRWILFPALYLDLTAYLRSMPGKEKEQVVKAVESPAIPLKLHGYEKLSKAVLFLPRPTKSPALPPLRVDDLIADDTNRLELFIVAAGPDCLVASNTEFVHGASASFVLENQQLEDLRKRQAVLPLDEARDSVRRKFLEHS